MFTKYIDNVSIDYLYKENSNYPFLFTVKSKNKNDPKVTFYLNCDYDLYIKEYDKLHKSLCDWIDQEKKLHDKLGYSSDCSFLFLFRNASIISLPDHLESISNSCIQQPYQIFPRFMNFLSYIEISLAQDFLEAIKGRFFYFLLNSKVKYNLEWKYSDFYKLSYYYQWVYLISVFQSTNFPVLTSKLDII